ncbi:MAG: hypothetical protein E5Y02_28555 [Mesorhizobium sp.]|nr:MAG: hypothetical protein E5Y02_28555 [Mesorhizobium sp.]
MSPVERIEGFRKNLAILVAIDNYASVPTLKTPIGDAADLARVLHDSHGFDTEIVTDANATFDKLTELLASLPDRIGSNDRVLFYFAGHGIALSSDEGPKGYILPQDADRDLTDRYLSMVDLNKALSALPCRHMLVILDCCFAGAFRWAATRDIVIAPGDLRQERYQWFIEGAAWQAIASAAHDQKAMDVASEQPLGLRVQNAEHSPFAGALIKGLEGAADLHRADQDKGDGVITATELFLYLEDKLMPVAGGGRPRQDPILWPLQKHGKGEFVFLVPGQKLDLPPAPPLDPDANPWRGLRVYDTAQSDLFFGRRKASDALFARVLRERFIVVTGASGLGKSSLVRAGLLPRLDASQFHSIVVRPGPMPFASLAAGLRNAALTQMPLIDEQTLKSDRLALANWVKAQPGDYEILLVVDQVEELITMGREDKKYLDLIAAALDKAGERLRVVFTLRSEFEPQFAQSALKDRWPAARYLIPAMTQDELQRVVEGPASVKVMRFESEALVDQLVNDVVQMPGALPMLSFALSEMYAHYLKRSSDDRTLTSEDYDALGGGVTGSLRVRANQIVDEIGESTARRILERFVSIEAGAFARRRVLKRELEVASAAENTCIEKALKRLDETRLTVTDSVNGDTYLELAHDALILGWDRLLNWVREDAKRIAALRLLTPNAEEWATSPQKKTGLLWSDAARVATVKELRAASTPGLNGIESRFAESSVRRARRNSILRSITVSALVFLLGAAVIAAKYAQTQTTVALGRLNTAIEEAAGRMLQLGETKLAYDPAVSIRLAEAADRLDPNLSINELRGLYVRAAYKNPVWARLPPHRVDKNATTLFPPVYEQSEQPFAANLDISYVLMRHPTDETELALYDVAQSTIVANLSLKSATLLDDEPYARQLVALLKQNPGNRPRLEIFDLSPAGLASPSVTVDDGMVYSCANGAWPCVVGKADGTVLIFSRDNSGAIDSREIGIWPGLTRIKLHPTGESFFLTTAAKQVIWVGGLKSPAGIIQRNLNLAVGNWYIYKEEFPWIVWGPAPNQLVALEIVASDSASQSAGKAILTAVNALSGRTQILREAVWEDSGIGRQALASDLHGNRIVWVRSQEQRGMAPEVFTLRWPDSSNDVADGGKVVEALQGRESGLLFGDLPATAMANVQTIAVSPNGRFAVVANDVRGTSGDQEGRGTLESWNLTLLPDNNPDGSSLIVSSQAHAVRIAYAADSSRIAVLDALGTVSVFRVRTAGPPSLSIGLRIPEALYDRLAPGVRSVGEDRRYWLVRYGESDHRLYDLATGNETRLEQLLPGERILAAAFFGNELNIATSKRIARFKDGMLLQTRMLESPAENASIAETTLSVRTANRIILFDRTTLLTIGWTDNGQASLEIPDNELDSYGPVSLAQLPDYYSQENKIRAFQVHQGRLEAWEATAQPTPGPLKFVRMWSKELPVRGWSSLRRLHNPNVVLMLSGANDPDVTPVLWQLDGISGEIQQRYILPEAALAPGRKIFEIFDVMPLKDNRIGIVFRFSPSAVAVGTWSRDGGRAVSWHEHVSDSDLVDARADSSNSILMTLRHYSDDDGQRVYSLFDPASDQTVWSGKLDEVLVAPYLQRISDRWVVANDTSWRKVERLVLTGGGKMADEITTVRLPAEEVARIEKLTAQDAQPGFFCWLTNCNPATRANAGQ